ncbi:Catalase [Beutenbergia cavernae DSM 12333]|uniref:Catalase n=1 Tax=Beutenbergia cavernae (strain ATCC BAA-8 / DSM 12333 / CCUG 43141 / JCM 11478 / NBRC 16432 / NCIMB 13614 / HKI 0122) TaxID=471853 RepID=C5C0T6_BEUC1|nr:catalase [Beutenbergia cavernae]ACQ81482.1 Catalase [Beutenbergia cavernae DSM 12333]
MTAQSHHPATTNDFGAPVGSDQHSLTTGPDGPVVLHDHYLVEKLAHFNRERVPERVVHAKGSGAFGTLEITHDVSRYTKAALFQPGTTTRALARFSTVAGEQGSPDTWRDPRGFALKFYTSEGNYDLVGNNTPVFFIRDSIQFPDFIHSQKRRSDTGLRDHDMQWDFWTRVPASAHQVTWLMGDRGIPRTWRHMDGFGSHTYQWVNAGGERFWVKYHFKTDQGIEFLTQDDADATAGIDADAHRRDLVEAIERGEFPSWSVKVQVMPYADAAAYRFNPFDLTKVWSQKDYPLIDVGTMRLDRNPEDFHAEIEQAAFSPSTLVPGIGLSPDKMLLGRVFAYGDAHRYRIGANYAQLPVNAPEVEVRSYTQAGPMRHTNYPPSRPTYAPNSFGGPHADPAAVTETDAWSADAEFVRRAYTLRPDDDDFGQAGTLVREVLDDAARDRLVGNIAGHLLAGVSEPILLKAFAYWSSVDVTLGGRVERVVREVQRRAVTGDGAAEPVTSGTAAPGA